MSDVMFAGMESLTPATKTDSTTVHDHRNITTALDEENRKHAKYSFMCKVLKDCLDEGLLKEPTATKVRNKFLAYDTSQCLRITSQNKSCQLLGLDRTTGPPLTYEEKRTLRQCFIDKLNTYTGYEKKIVKIVGNFSATNEPIVEAQHKVMLDTRASLEKAVDAYAKNVMEQMELLEEIRRLRHEHLPETCTKKCQETKLMNAMSECKARCINQRVKMNVMTETPVTKNAYKVLMEDIAKQQEECRNEIKELAELKEKYKVVACKEFEEILKSYLGYLSSIDALKRINLKL